MLGFSNKKQETSWKKYFNLFYEAFTTENLYVSEESDSITLTAWCFHDGEQIPYKYNLFLLNKSNFKSTIQKLTFSLLLSSKLAKQLETENEKLKAKVEKLKNKISIQHSQNNNENDFAGIDLGPLSQSDNNNIVSRTIPLEQQNNSINQRIVQGKKKKSAKIFIF